MTELVYKIFVLTFIKNGLQGSMPTVLPAKRGFEMVSYMDDSLKAIIHTGSDLAFLQAI